MSLPAKPKTAVPSRRMVLRAGIAAGIGALGAGALVLGRAPGDDDQGAWTRWRSHARPLLVTQGRFGRVEVLALGSLRFLVFDSPRGRVLQSAVDLADPGRLVVPYCRLMMVAAAYTARFDEVALIGLGAGAMAGYLARTYAPARLEVAEIDPLVVSLAESHFGLQPARGLRVLTTDGRAMLAAGGRPYDAILGDAYGGDEIPASLATRQFYETVCARLTPDGVYVQNLTAWARHFESVLATIAAVFPMMDTYRVEGNWVIVASAGRPASTRALVERAVALDARHAPRHPLAGQLELAETPPPFARAPVLVDSP